MELQARTALVPILAATVVLALPSPAAGASLSPRSKLSTAGLGPVRIGMSRDQAEEAGGVRLEWTGARINGCRYARPRNRSIRALFMVIEGRIARVDAARRGIRTPSGIRVGDSEASVRRKLGDRLRVSPHEYDPNGHYLEFVPRDEEERNRRVVFETDGDEVTYMRAGRLPEVRYIEGCA